MLVANGVRRKRILDPSAARVYRRVMTEKPAKPAAKTAPDSREARLKAALKANLQRRKAQAKARDAEKKA